MLFKPRSSLSLLLSVPAALLFATLAFAQESKTETPVEPPVSEAAADSAAKKPQSKEPERVVKTDEEWRKLLTHDQYLVTRLKATEPPFSGKYATGHFKGTFLCVCCGAKLFDARHKFEIRNRMAELLAAPDIDRHGRSPGPERNRASD